MTESLDGSDDQPRCRANATTWESTHGMRDATDQTNCRGRRGVGGVSGPAPVGRSPSTGGASAGGHPAVTNLKRTLM